MTPLLLALSSLLLSNVPAAAWSDAPAGDAAVEEAPIRLVVHEPVLRLHVHASSSAPADARAFATVDR